LAWFVAYNSSTKTILKWNEKNTSGTSAAEKGGRNCCTLLGTTQNTPATTYQHINNTEKTFAIA